MTAASGGATPEMGAYGLRVAGLAGATAWMQPQMPGAPLLRVLVEQGEPDTRPSEFDADSADLRFIDGGRLVARKDSDTVLYRFPERPPDTDLLHPYLAPAAALRWQWAGREALHAGAFATRRGAVLVLGDKGAGKSTTLAWLAVNRGTTVLADDLAVMNGRAILAGPRSVDLRSGAGAAVGIRVGVGAGMEIGVGAGVGVAAQSVRRGERLRLGLAPAPGSLVLAGVVVLEWGSLTKTIPVPFADRLALLAAQRSFPGLPADPVALLDLAAVPMVRLRRPRHVSALTAVGSALENAFC